MGVYLVSELNPGRIAIHLLPDLSGVVGPGLPAVRCETGAVSFVWEVHDMPAVEPLRIHGLCDAPQGGPGHGLHAGEGVISVVLLLTLPFVIPVRPLGPHHERAVVGLRAPLALFHLKGFTHAGTIHPQDPGAALATVPPGVEEQVSPVLGPTGARALRSW